MDVEDNTIDGKNTDLNQVILDDGGSNRGGEDEGKIGKNREEFRGRAEVVVKATGH
jgi:hypothetical protein